MMMRANLPECLACGTCCFSTLERYVPVAGDTPTILPPPGLPFSLVFRAEPGKEDVLLQIASAYEAASKRRIPPPAFGPLPTHAGVVDRGRP